MSARDNILSRLRAVEMGAKEQTSTTFEPIRFEDKVAHFAEMVKSVGGSVVEGDGSLVDILVAMGVDTENLVSSLAEFEGKALNPDSVADVHELGGDYTAVVRGKVAVAENGAVWVPVEGRRRAHIFACQHLVLVVSKSDIVDTMHDAMERISLDDIAYGAFVSGPSKTADIEQALVMGAHGAMRATVVIK